MTIIGHVSRNIPIYKNTPYFDHKRIDHKDERGIYYGLKWQCIELVRRCYIHMYGVTFIHVMHACDIFELKHGSDIETGRKVPFTRVKNNGTSYPEKGDIIVWNQCDEFPVTGHTAIVMRVNKKTIKIAEQNGPTLNGTRLINIHDKNILGWIRI